MSHGGGCGLHAGAVAGGKKLVTVPGNGVKPVGLAMPLLKGVNDAPAGFGTKSGCVRNGSTASLGVGKNLLSGDDWDVSAGPGLSNCRNRSIAASCSRSGLVAAWGKGWLNASQPMFPFWFAKSLRSGWLFRSWLQLRAVVALSRPE